MRWFHLFQAIGTGDPIHEDQETITTLEGVEHIARPKGVTGTHFPLKHFDVHPFIPMKD